MHITEYPKRIELLATELAACSEDMAAVREQIKDVEMRATASVLEARTDEGKPAYTNDKSRELALYFNLRANDLFQRDKVTERILEQKRGRLEAEIERLRREYRIGLIDYEQSKLGRRDAA